MSTPPQTIDDPELGRLHRAETTLDDGDIVVHDWFAGTLTIDGHEVELMIDGADADSVSILIPRVHSLVDDLDAVRRRASDAVVTQFSESAPSHTDLDQAADDLVLDTIEITDDSTVLHFTDSCGEHFPAGFWPAVHLKVNGEVAEVTVEG
ncbi:hypothetical protein [Microbacterium sp. USHLN186]|uniref:hypothetical protein n=1 Tax=Microbacterium sp. USHLN186 TaxID=3081286 RepID=UPI0030177D38